MSQFLTRPPSPRGFNLCLSFPTKKQDKKTCTRVYSRERVDERVTRAQRRVARVIRFHVRGVYSRAWHIENICWLASCVSRRIHADRVPKCMRGWVLVKVTGQHRWNLSHTRFHRWRVIHTRNKTDSCIEFSVCARTYVRIVYRAYARSRVVGIHDRCVGGGRGK